MQQNPSSSAYQPNNPDAPLSITRDQVIAHANSLLLNPEPVNNSLFIVKPANYWMEQARNRPLPKMLFVEFWFEGEICIMFADTNLGKSILAVQIADSISSGKALPWINIEAHAQPVLYFDFELTDKQFENRYSVDYADHYCFHDNFWRIEFNPDSMPPDGYSFEDYLSECLEETIIQRQAKVLIIDNLTYLRNETEKAKDALPLMKHLKALKSKYNLSILVLAHTPKRDISKPITRNDLSGSKMLINFCDSAFSIGESFKDKNLRYLKQIKQRNTEQLYGADNVVVCEIVKPANFLQFNMIGHSPEREHLKEPGDNDHVDVHERVLELRSQNLTMREIAKELGISSSMVDKHLKKA